MGAGVQLKRDAEDSLATPDSNGGRRINDLPAHGDRLRILIVEDHQVVADALAALLNQQPDLLVVGSVGSVADSAHRAKEVRPDIVVLDFHLADGTGADAAVALRQAGCEAPMIFLTRDDGEKVRSAAIASGASGVLHKSLAGAEVADAIRVVAGGASLFSPVEIAALFKRHPDVAEKKNMLTRRERQVLDLVYKGTPNRGIAARLGISYTTVRTHIHSVVSKLGVHSKLEVIAKARALGVID